MIMLGYESMLKALQSYIENVTFDNKTDLNINNEMFSIRGIEADNPEHIVVNIEIHVPIIHENVDYYFQFLTLTEINTLYQRIKTLYEGYLKSKENIIEHMKRYKIMQNFSDVLRWATNHYEL